MDNSYEFSADQNKVIGKTGSRVRLWGILSLFVAVLMLLAGVASLSVAPAAALIYLVPALIPFFVGLAFMRAGKALNGVTTTEGHDVALLMDAMDNLSRAFGIQLVASLAWIAILVVGTIAAMALPKFVDTKAKAYEVQQLADLNGVMTAQTQFFNDSARYTSDVRALVDRGFQPSQGITIALSGDSAGWTATSTHELLKDKGCAVFGGTVAAMPSTVGGKKAARAEAVVCDGDGD